MWRVNTLPRPVSVGIRREDRLRIWERRAPLTPDAVHNLISSSPPCNGRKSVLVEVVSCSRRVFTDAEYERAGARIVPRLSNPNVILGVKEPPIPELDQLHSPQITPDFSNAQSEAPTHLMFSHTFKGQLYNMPLLSRFLKSPPNSDSYPSQDSSPGSFSERNRICPTLIDFELLTDKHGKRTVGFGWFAGAAGVPEAFSSMAQHHLEHGIASPFLYTARPYTHRTLDDMRKNLQLVGSIILSQGLPAELGPFVIGLTGNGNVSRGVLDTLKDLPLTKVKAEELPGLMSNSQYDRHTIYFVHIRPEDYIFRDDGQGFVKAQYYRTPEKYKSQFHERIAPYLTLFINGVGWRPTFPRLMTKNQLLAATHKASNFPGFRFLNIADISCDINGGLEFLDKATSLSAPFYDIPIPAQGNGGLSVPPLRIMAVDILPTALPIDASKRFSDVLLPYLATLIEEDSCGEGSSLLEAVGDAEGPGGGSPSSSRSSALRRATVARGGELMEGHKWLKELVDKHVSLASDRNFAPDSLRPSRTTAAAGQMKSLEGRSTKKKVLLLGSGMVAQPVVDYLACKAGVQVSIASNSAQELNRLAMPYTANGIVETSLVDFDDSRKYEALVLEADVVISLLPAHMHHNVAEVCIAAGKPLVTASYMSPAMESLNDRAKQRGILILTEMGLDPGLDHVSALSLIDKLKRPRRSLSSFVSLCGGLPILEDALDVPLKYKFSWRPEGVLIAALQEAQYILLGSKVVVKGDDLLRNCWRNLPVVSAMELEGLPNRDSYSYLGLYQLGSMRTFVRGTLRYPGYSSLLDSFKKLGLLNTAKKISPQDWNSLVRESMSAQYGSEDGFIPALPEVIPAEDLEALHDALEWLGLTSRKLVYNVGIDNGAVQDRNVMPPLPSAPATPLSIFAYLLSHKLRYRPTDKDMVILSHEIISVDRGYWGGPEKVHTSTLVSYGTDRMHTGFHGERPASAMARTVGFPAAIAAMLIVEGKLNGLVGVRRPVEMEICRPILRELEEMGIAFEETTRHLRVGKGFVGIRNKVGTVEGALALSVSGVPEEKRRRLESGRWDPAWNLDLDSDKSWEEEEFVEWTEKASRRGR